MTIRAIVVVAALVLLSVAVSSEPSFYRPVTRVVHYHAPLPRYAYSRHVHVHEPVIRYVDHPPPHHHVTVERLVEAPHIHSHPHFDHYWRRR